jgi:hypothetical protein
MTGCTCLSPCPPRPWRCSTRDTQALGACEQKPDRFYTGRVGRNSYNGMCRGASRVRHMRHLPIGHRFSLNRPQSSQVIRWQPIISKTVLNVISPVWTCFQVSPSCSGVEVPRRPRFCRQRKRSSYKRAYHEFFSQTDEGHSCQKVSRTSYGSVMCGTM